MAAVTRLTRPREAAVSRSARRRSAWRRGVPAALLLVATVLAACATVSPAPRPSSSPSSVLPASPGASAPLPAASGWPDVSQDPVEASPSMPPFVPPQSVSPVQAARGLVLHVPVLMYHRVIPPALAGDSLPGLVVPPELFAAQMATLAGAGWHTITAAELASDLAAGVRPPPRTFVITFDDGYDDGYTYALPILQAHHFVATFYVIAGRIGDAAGPLQALTPAHVAALAAAGMEIGNHTYNHVDLATAPPGLARYQVVAASARILALTGAAPRTLAYPFGGWSSAAAAVVDAAGIVLAFTTAEGARETWAGRLGAPRVRVGPLTSPAGLRALMERYSPPLG